ncbi:MAG: hypothetical protein Kow002_00430 [Anaerolineales bacterium]
MNRAARAFNVFLAASLSLVFATSGLLALMVYNLEKRLFDSDVYIRALDDEQIYARLPTLTADLMMEAAQSEESVLASLSEVPQNEWEAVARLILPPELLKSITDDVIVQTIAYVNRESEDATVSLAALKIYLLSPTGVDAIYQLLLTQPDCTLEQMTSMVTGGSSFILCRPPEQFLGFDLRPLYEAEIRATVSIIPDEISLLDQGENANKAISELSRLRTLSRLMPVIPLLVLLIITLLVVRSFKDWLTWWGVPLLLTSLPGILVNLSAGFLFDTYFQTTIAPEMGADMPPSIVTAVQDISRAVVIQALEPMLLQLLTLGVAGGLMLLLATLTQKAKRSKR